MPDAKAGICDCGEGYKEYRLTLTDLEGTVLDLNEVCGTCLRGASLDEILTLPKEG